MLENLSLSVYFMKEGGAYVAYSPALDLSTCAETFEKAQKRFNEIVGIFFKELVKTGTLEEVLVDLGWRQGKDTWMPPTVVAHQSIWRFCLRYSDINLFALGG